MKLKPVSGKKLIRLLSKKGYWVKSQRGSHIHLRHPIKRPVTVPNHKVISKGTLKAILKATELKAEDLK